MNAKVDVVEPMGMETLVHFFVDGEPLTARIDPAGPRRPERGAAARRRHEPDAPDRERQRARGLMPGCHARRPHRRRRHARAASSPTSSGAGCERGGGGADRPLPRSPPISPGHDSHGVIRVPRYVREPADGKVFAGRTITVVNESADARGRRWRIAASARRSRRRRSISASPRRRRPGWRSSRCAMPAISAASATGASARPRPGWSSIHFVNVGAGRARRAVRRRRPALLHQPVLHRHPGEGSAPPLLLDMATVAGGGGQGAGRLQRRQAGARRAR